MLYELHKSTWALLDETQSTWILIKSNSLLTW